MHHIIIKVLYKLISQVLCLMIKTWIAHVLLILVLIEDNWLVGRIIPPDVI